MAPVVSPRTPRPKTAALELKGNSNNYFGLAIDHANSSIGKNRASKSNWSPATTHVRSAAADSPHTLPLESNPDYAQFRRQTEDNHFRLSQSSISLPGLDGEATSRPASRPTPRRNESHSGTHIHAVPTPQRRVHQPETVALMEPPESRSPKRVLLHDSSNAFDSPRRESPAAFQDGFESSSSISGGSLSNGSPPSRRDHNLHPRAPPSAAAKAMSELGQSRAETLPTKLTPSEGVQMVTSQYLVNLLESAGEEVLILDLRVSTQHAKSRLTGALNLCVPTTLLKRASHNVQKLAETFKDPTQRIKFESWRSSRAIVVYDQSSSHLKEAMTCQNVLKKFSSEGWEGSSYIIRGGFVEFAHNFPRYVDTTRIALAAPASSSLSLRPSTPSVAPVIGGCPMPASKSAANPFFGNIRQNMDLIGGVGQFPVKRPQSLDKQAQDDLPHWLAQAVDEPDQGKHVAGKFLQIEKREQKRLQEALSGNVSFGTPGPQSDSRVQIAGIEKGSKNRYNNIWPYEHSRVKLCGVASDGCDYVNASHVESSISRKKFIATQAPMPSTAADFWSMVWQSESRVIVMLTAEKEGGQIKAHDYWSGEQYGPVHVHFLAERRASLEPSRISKRRDRSNGVRQRSSTTTSMSDSGPAMPEQPYVLVRKMTISHEDQPFERMREITQLQYSSWPDFGVPTHPSHLLGLVEQCDTVVRASAGGSDRPVVVHCSAGCGRTGTFCTVDTVVDAMKNAERRRPPGHEKTASRTALTDSPFFSRIPGSLGMMELDTASLHGDDVDLIEQTVEEFRLQRLSMVQSLRQFVLCYEAVLEWYAQEAPPKTA